MAAYPKDFFDEWKGSVERQLCLGIMPFDPSFRAVWDAIRDVAEGDPFNMRCVRADDVARPGFIMEDVLEYIARARLVVADLTGRNPNVFYELGIAHTSKPSASVVLLAQSIDDVPFDLRHLRCLIYEADLPMLGRELDSVLSQSLERRYLIEVREGQNAQVPARLTGRDNCLYEVEVLTDYVGEEGVKFRLRRTRFVAGRNPEIGKPDNGHYLGDQERDLALPNLGWKLLYGGRADDVVRLFLVREDE